MHRVLRVHLHIPLVPLAFLQTHQVHRHTHQAVPASPHMPLAVQVPRRTNSGAQAHHPTCRARQLQLHTPLAAQVFHRTPQGPQAPLHCPQLRRRTHLAAPAPHRIPQGAQVRRRVLISYCPTASPGETPKAAAVMCTSLTAHAEQAACCPTWPTMATQRTAPVAPAATQR